jgi:hypothetical protein
MVSVFFGRINTDPRLPGGAILTIVSVLTVGFGVWLRWLIVRPGYRGPVPQIYISGMETGIAGLDYLILGIGGIGLITSLTLSIYYNRRLVGGLVKGTTGLSIVLLTLLWIAETTALDTLWWFIETNGFDAGTTEVYVSGTGVYLTFIGGVLLMMAGGSELLHSQRQNIGSSRH